MNANRRGITNIPTAPAIAMNPTAMPMVLATPARSTDPCWTIRVTTVRMMRPRTSSATAAPRTMRASVDESARKSPKTRAVIPTLVAASAAPRNSDAFSDSPRTDPANTPEDIGTTTPMMATSIDARPTLRNSVRSISRPTSASKIMTPTSANIRIASLGSMRPSIEGPITMPAMISPSTAGTRILSNNSAAILATMRMIARSVKIEPKSIAPLLASSAVFMVLVISHEAGVSRRVSVLHQTASILYVAR
ncbi:unannotated protein [freshwater metagenome]|uniref:Unannotated protein n=1 Tax=freshwater metagenome TaxID=449393 RepID=A0A6J6VFX5_9ZZZZ